MKLFLALAPLPIVWMSGAEYVEAYKWGVNLSNYSIEKQDSENIIRDTFEIKRIEG